MQYFTLRILKTTLSLTFLLTSFAYCNTLAPISTGETPASLACVYGLTPQVPGCPINGTTAVPTSGTGAIAIIDGQDDPNAYNELTQFSNQTGLYPLPPCSTNQTPCFQQYYVSNPFNPLAPCVAATNSNNAAMYGITPSSDIEPELDIEWAHAMAPKASIYMVETQGWVCAANPTSNITSLLQGMQCAAFLLKQNNGGGIISYSHSFPEWPGEVAYDSAFTTPGIIYIASSGDYSAPANYPASSPNVIAAGGSYVVRDSAGNYTKQIAWRQPEPVTCTPTACNPFCKTGGSGGPSVYESRPSYQNSVQKIVGTQRGTPDISFAAANVNVFCCQLSSDNKCCGSDTKIACQNTNQTSNVCISGLGAWVTTGGTSLASPALAGVINSANSGATTTAQELMTIYNGAIKNYASNWTDITYGDNGYSALRGYDFTTGLGVPYGYGGK